MGLAEYLKKMDYSSADIIPGRLGEVNKETKYALETFHAETPRLLTSLSGDFEVILVDHNTPGQSLDSVKEQLVGLVDHHAISGFESSGPVNIIDQVIGSTCTIVYQLFKTNNIVMSNQTAGLLLSGIISDTRLLISSTTTSEDKEAFDDLTRITGIDSNKYGTDLLVKGADLSDYTEEKLITYDTKSYVVNKYPIQISSIQAGNVDDILNRKTKILEEMDKYIKENKIELFVTMILGVFDKDSYVLVRGNLSNVVEKAFDVELKDNQAFLQGVSSRKNDLYPPISREIDKLEENKNAPVEPEDDGTDEDFNKIPNSSGFIGKMYLALITYVLLF